MIHKNIKLSVLHMLAKEGLQVTKHGQVEWSLPSSDNKPNNTEQWSLVHCVYFDRIHILPMFRNKSGFSVENLSSLTSFNWTVSGFLNGTFLQGDFFFLDKNTPSMSMWINSISACWTWKVYQIQKLGG